MIGMNDLLYVSNGWIRYFTLELTGLMQLVNLYSFFICYVRNFL